MVFFQNVGSRTNAVFIEIKASKNPMHGFTNGAWAMLSSVDIDGDGDPDIFIDAKCYENTQTPTVSTFTEALGIQNPMNGFTTSVRANPVVIDIDDDGDGDLVVGAGTRHNNGAGGTLSYFENIGSSKNAVFVERKDGNNFMNNINVVSSSSPALADLDGDTDLDMIVGNGAGLLFYFENTGVPANPTTTPVFTARTGAQNPMDGVNVGGNASPSLIDLDNDGVIDMFVGSENGAVYYFKNTGNKNTPTFTKQNGGSNPLNGVDVGHRAVPTISNVNNLFIGSYQGSIYYYVINTANTFALQTGTLNPMSGLKSGTWSAPSLYDMDGDGDLDLFVGNYDGTISYFERNACVTQCSGRGLCKSDETLPTCDCFGLWSGKNCENCPQGAIEVARDGTDLMKFAEPPTCKICNAGTWSDISGYILGGASCVPCNAGFYGDLRGAKSLSEGCKACPTGFYQSQSSKTSCDICSAGSYSVDVISCYECKKGQFRPSKQNGGDNLTDPTTCIDCPIGQIMPIKGATKCNDCIPGQFQNETGNERCVECASGRQFNSSVAVGVSPLNCLVCGEGRHQPVKGSTFCLPCLTGTFQNVTGSSLCNDCPIGFSNGQTEKESCTFCPTGTFQDAKQEANCKGILNVCCTMMDLFWKIWSSILLFLFKYFLLFLFIFSTCISFV